MSEPYEPEVLDVWEELAAPGGNRWLWIVTGPWPESMRYIPVIGQDGRANGLSPEALSNPEHYRYRGNVALAFPVEAP
jgi:hypothetical protein